MNDLNKKQQTDPKPKYNPAFEAQEGELSSALKERSVDRLLKFTLDQVSDDAQSVLNLDHMVPEEKKWEEMKTVKGDFKAIGDSLNEILDNPLIKDKKQELSQKFAESMFKSIIGKLNDFEIMLNSLDVVNALGREFIFVLNYIIDTIRNQTEILIATAQNDPKEFYKVLDEFLVFRHTFMDKVMKGLITEKSTSDPVQVQIFNNMTNSLDIPEFPLNEISDLYTDFEQKAPSDDFSQVLKVKMAEYVESNRKQLQAEIDKERQRALKIKAEFADLNPKFKEILTGYADYWLEMTPEKLFRYILRRRAIENLAEGRVTITHVESLNNKLQEMHGTMPTGQLSEEDERNLTLKQRAEFEKWKEQKAKKPPIDAEAMAEADKIHIELEEVPLKEDKPAQQAGSDNEADFGDLFADEEEEPPKAATDEIPKGDKEVPPYEDIEVDDESKK